MQEKAVCLLSGGLDSATMAAMAIEEGFSVHAMTFSYGQRHQFELSAAQQIAKRLGVVEHRLVSLDLRAFGGSSLTSDEEVPVDRSIDEMKAGIPSTYVPGRNTIFLSFAVAWAEVLGAHDIFIGVNALDYAGYPDCRPEYIDAFQNMAQLATKVGVEGKSLSVHTPLINMTKAQIIARGLELGVDYSLTNTCYSPSPTGEACGRCDACLLRIEGFNDNETQDPATYVVA